MAGCRAEAACGAVAAIILPPACGAAGKTGVANWEVQSSGLGSLPPEKLIMSEPIWGAAGGAAGMGGGLGGSGAREMRGESGGCGGGAGGRGGAPPCCGAACCGAAVA